MEPLKLRYFDSHVHLLDYQQSILPQVMDEAYQAGVQKLVCNTTCEEEYQPLEELAGKEKSIQIIKSFGIHPYKVGKVKQGWLERLQSKLKEDQSNLVGEIGLDYRKQILEANPKEQQIDVFDRQVKLACQYDRTMSIHCVRAHGDMLKYLKKLSNSTNNVPNLVLHSYGGPKQITQSLLKLKLNIFFSLSQKRNDELCEVIPVDKLLFETDAPYQLDKQIVQGQTLLRENINELKFINLNSVLHERYGIPLPALVNQVWLNSLKAFKILV